MQTNPVSGGCKWKLSKKNRGHPHIIQVRHRGSIVILGGGTLKEVHFHALRSSLFQCNLYIYICMVVRWSTSWSMNISGNTLFEGSSAIQWRNKDIGFPRTIRWLAVGKEIPLEGRLIPWNSSSGKPWSTAMYLLVMSTVCYWSHGPVEIVSFSINSMMDLSIVLWLLTRPGILDECGIHPGHGRRLRRRDTLHCYWMPLGSLGSPRDSQLAPTIVKNGDFMGTCQQFRPVNNGKTWFAERYGKMMMGRGNPSVGVLESFAHHGHHGGGSTCKAPIHRSCGPGDPGCPHSHDPYISTDSDPYPWSILPKNDKYLYQTTLVYLFSRSWSNRWYVTRPICLDHRGTINTRFFDLWSWGCLIRWSADPLIRWCADPLIRWSADPMIRWSPDPMIRWSDDGWAAGWWSADPLIRWSTDPRIRWSADPMIRWSSDPMIRWSAYPMIRWSDDPMMAGQQDDDPLIRWSADPLIRWSADPPIRWSADPLIRCWCLQCLFGGSWATCSAVGMRCDQGTIPSRSASGPGWTSEGAWCGDRFLQVCVRADLQGNKILALVERNLFLGSHSAVTAQPLLPSLLV